jgi:hypothetical protein
MRAKISAQPGQPPQDAERIDIAEVKEGMGLTDIRLTDGSELRLKTVVLEVWRLEGVYDAENNPQYVVRSAGVMTVHAPENLKRKMQ